jgi:hypothetical protein
MALGRGAMMCRTFTGHRALLWRFVNHSRIPFMLGADSLVPLRRASLLHPSSLAPWGWSFLLCGRHITANSPGGRLQLTGGGRLSVALLLNSTASCAGCGGTPAPSAHMPWGPPPPQ